MTRYVDFRHQNGHCEQQKNVNAQNNHLPEHEATKRRDPLPIDRYRRPILKILRNFERTLVFIGETGSGKSTQIPQYCHEASLSKNGLIAVTQPRRVAAKTLAERVAFEMGSEVGQLVGYKFRFESKTCKNTKIVYQTEGVLLREAQNDALLRNYSLVILDEVHERTVNTDMLMLVLRKVQKQRRQQKEKPLRIILMSATMDVEKLHKYFGKPEIYHVQGRQHPIRLYYGESLKANDNDYLFNAISTVLQLHENEPKDHGFLVFLTGQEEIETAIKVIRRWKKTERELYESIHPLPLYAAINMQQQSQVFLPPPEGCRKVVFATNIAETSITIPGIHVVIDSGKVKRKRFSAKNHIDILKVENIAKAQAIQRAGRAGREAPGKCFRLYANEDYDSFDDVQTPELLRSNISWALLHLIELGMNCLNSLQKHLMDQPEPEQIPSALEELLLLQAIEVGKMEDSVSVNTTGEGDQMLRFPVEPAYSKILLAASKLDCLEEACIVVAFLSTESVFQPTAQDLFCKLENGEFGGGSGQQQTEGTSLKFGTNEGDHVRMVLMYRALNSIKNLKTGNDENFYQTNGVNKYRIEHVFSIQKQLVEICRKEKLQFRSCGNDFHSLRQAICRGLFQNLCIYSPTRKCYLMERDQAVQVRIHPSSCMANLSNAKIQAFVYTELVQTNGIYARNICPVQLEWMSEIHKQTSRDSIGTQLDRIRQHQLVRCSPCSSISSTSTTSSTTRRRRRQAKQQKETAVEENMEKPKTDPQKLELYEEGELKQPEAEEVRQEKPQVEQVTQRKRKAENHENLSELEEKKVAKSVGHMLTALRKQPAPEKPKSSTQGSSIKPKVKLVEYEDDSEESDNEDE